MIPTLFPALETPAGHRGNRFPERAFTDNPTIFSKNPAPETLDDAFFEPEEEEYFCFEI